MQPLTYTITKPPIIIPGQPLIPGDTIVLPTNLDDGGTHEETCIQNEECAVDIRSLGGNLTTDYFFTSKCYTLKFGKIDAEIACRLIEDFYECQFNNHTRLQLSIEGGCNTCCNVKDVCVRMSYDQKCLTYGGKNGKWLTDFEFTLCECGGCDDGLLCLCEQSWSQLLFDFIGIDNFGGVLVDGIYYDSGGIPTGDYMAINTFLNGLGVGTFNYVNDGTIINLQYYGEGDFEVIVFDEIAIGIDCECGDAVAALTELCYSSLCVPVGSTGLVDWIMVNGIPYFPPSILGFPIPVNIDNQAQVDFLLTTIPDLVTFDGRCFTSTSAIIDSISIAGVIFDGVGNCEPVT